ncbi:PEP-CTERM sorting domain-containing protein [Sphingomonas bacterium]|uniref:PEP-CTERM sorting domain-containing protein n=1 Tax=Sphingomonas bacterium TaxID=1895847 RepID=UPI0020C6724A|nr:PEP-CTERM sorting domain-containing protein [Sphingomonas bacterium]
MATQGMLLVSKSSAAQGLTFAGITNLAVYQNTLGTLDFYYQFERTGAGTIASDAIETITGSSFVNYVVDALVNDADPDGAGAFEASTNVGAVATAQRNDSGSVVGIDFASANPVADNEISATYIFRTNATNYALGTFGVIDGSTISGQGFQPAAAAAVPEASTWAMMLMGFGGLGAVMRGRRTRTGKAGFAALPGMAGE